MKSEIRKSVHRLVEMQFGVMDVQESDRLVEDIGAESMDVANLVASIEEKFEIIMKESEIARILTLHDLYTVVDEKLNES